MKAGTPFSTPSESGAYLWGESALVVLVASSFQTTLQFSCFFITGFME